MGGHDLLTDYLSVFAAFSFSPSRWKIVHSVYKQDCQSLYTKKGYIRSHDFQLYKFVIMEASTQLLSQHSIKQAGN